MEEIRKLIREHYGLEAISLKPLEGYEDKTYLMASGEGNWILKEHLFKPGIKERISLEVRLMDHFASSGTYSFPKHRLTRSGQEALLAGNRVFRVLSYLEGTFMGELRPAGIACPDRKWMQYV